jgi:NAD(P)-dependent dehydrogenase (short-subunit alcohol dehydrogenase family)
VRQGSGTPPSSPGRRFEGAVAIVTGAAQGIGRAAARRLGQEGATIVIADNAEAPARAALHELESLGIPARVVVADVSRLADAERVMQETTAAYGRIDVLVNNVGGTIWVKPYQHYAEDEVKAEIDRSLWSTLWCCRAVLPIMLEQRSGSIVNLGSLAPKGIYRVPYAAAKGGVIALTTSLALEVAQHGIRVNCVAPGPVEVTDRVTPRNPREPTSDELRWRRELEAALRKETPMDRRSTPEEQAAVIAFVASSDASFMTGQVLSVAGGGTVTG